MKNIYNITHCFVVACDDANKFICDRSEILQNGEDLL